MGTSKPGRYMNTKGSARTMSQFSLVHASEGKFTRPQRPTDPLKLMSGGHGQKGMNLLDKYGIAYNIVKIYPNEKTWVKPIVVSRVMERKDNKTCSRTCRSIT